MEHELSTGKKIFELSVASSLEKLPPTTGLCAGVALEFLPPVTSARLFIKINIKNQCLAMFVKPEQMLLCCYCRLLQPQAALAQNPLLAAVILYFIKNCFQFRLPIFDLSSVKSVISSISNLPLLNFFTK